MIKSIHNPKIQLVRELLSSSKDRKAHRSFIVEGVRLVEEAWQSSIKPKDVFFSQGLNARGKELIQQLIAADIPVEEVDPDLLNRISDTENTQGILAVMPMSLIDLPPGSNFFLILDSIRDPGNMGTILRTACAAGVHAVLVSEDCADIHSPKVMRSAMGAHFHLPIHSLSWPDLISTLNKYVDEQEIFLSDVMDGQSLWQCDLSRSIALIISNEAAGASPQARQIAGRSIHIPMPGNFESLNASIAAAILLFEVVRQRTKS